MHLYYDSRYFKYLVYPRFSIIRWIELILCIVCLALTTMAFDYNLNLVIKVLTVSVSAAFVFICFADVIAWMFRSPIGFAAWLMISLSGFLFFCLCGGCLFALKRITYYNYFFATSFFFVVAAVVFIFDYLWIALEYINLRRCIQVAPSGTLDRGISTCLCKFNIEACPQISQTETLVRTSRKEMYPSQNVNSGHKKSRKCGVCPRPREYSYSAPNASTSQSSEIPRLDKSTVLQTLPQMHTTTSDMEAQEHEYQLPLFKSDIGENPGPPYYLYNAVEKRNIPLKYYSTLDAVLERESSKGNSIDGLSDSENDSAGSSVSQESSTSYQTSAACSIKKLFEANDMCTSTKIPGGTEDSAQSYSYPAFRKEILSRKVQQTVRANLPSRIPIRPESKASLKTSKIIIKKPLSSPRITSRFQIRPGSRVSPSIDNKLGASIESGISPGRMSSPWIRQERNVLPRMHRSPQRKSNQSDSRLLRPRSLTRLNSASETVTNELNDNFLEYLTSGGDAGSSAKYCPTCRLFQSIANDGVDKKISGNSKVADSMDSSKPVKYTTYDDDTIGTCTCKINL